ncbi:lipoprotein [Synergistales bacterium]|nr:lipoprotein [Synergistales bacterium]
MKKQSMNFVLALTVVSVFIAVMFSFAPPGESAVKTITIGVAPFPNKDITEVAAGLLKKEGYTLKVKVYNDAVDINIALGDKSLDANYFQTIPYLADQMNEMTEYKFKWLTKIHKEPMGIYSAKYMRSVANLPADPIIAIPIDLPNQSRALHLLEYAGLILLKDGTMSNTNDILQNKQGITFLKVDAGDMPKVLSRVDAAVMNTATAINADMNPKRDAVVLEPINDAYSNVLVVRASDANKPEIKALVKAFTSPKVRKYIDDKLYSYGIVSAF